MNSLLTLLLAKLLSADPTALLAAVDYATLTTYGPGVSVCYGVDSDDPDACDRHNVPFAPDLRGLEDETGCLPAERAAKTCP
jgi:hypothetical protein